MGTDLREGAARGAGTGAKVAALVSSAYLALVVLGYAIDELDSDPQLLLGMGLTLLVGVVLGCLPAVLAGAVSGWLAGSLIAGAPFVRRRPVLASAAAAAIAGAVVVGIDALVLSLAGPLSTPLLMLFLGMPSLIFVVGFAAIGYWLPRKLA